MPGKGHAVIGKYLSFLIYPSVSMMSLPPLPPPSNHKLTSYYIRRAGRLNSHGAARIIATFSVFFFFFSRSHRLSLSIPSLELGHSEAHKETFVPSLVEWSLVLEVVKEIQGDRTSKQSQHKSCALKPLSV